MQPVLLLNIAQQGVRELVVATNRPQLSPQSEQIASQVPRARCSHMQRGHEKAIQLRGDFLVCVGQDQGIGMQEHESLPKIKLLGTESPQALKDCRSQIGVAARASVIRTVSDAVVRRSASARSRQPSSG